MYFCNWNLTDMWQQWCRVFLLHFSACRWFCVFVWEFFIFFSGESVLTTTLNIFFYIFFWLVIDGIYFFFAYISSFIIYRTKIYIKSWVKCFFIAHFLSLFVHFIFFCEDRNQIFSSQFVWTSMENFIQRAKIDGAKKSFHYKIKCFIYENDKFLPCIEFSSSFFFLIEICKNYFRALSLSSTRKY